MATTTQVETRSNFIDGEERPSVSGETEPVLNPATGEFKQSGYGKDMSMYSLEDYTEVKHVMVKLGR